MFDVRQAHSKIRQMFLLGYPRENNDIIFIIKLGGKSVCHS
jgi:hypothetical protein